MVRAKQATTIRLSWKGGVSCTYVNKNVGKPWGFAERIYGRKHDKGCKFVFVA